MAGGPRKDGTLSMTPNAIKKRNYRQRKQAEAARAKQQTATPAMGTPGAVPGAGPVAAPGAGVAGGTPALEVELKAALPPQPKLSLKERFLQRVQGSPQGAAPKPKRSPKKGEVNLITTLLPTMAASFIAAFARDRFPAEYKACAPTKEEVNGVIGPLMEILGEQVEVYGKVSQNMIRLTNSLICALAYATRAYVTYVDIKKAKEAGQTYEERKQHQRADYREQLEREAREYEAVVTEQKASEPSLAGGLRAYQAASAGPGGNAPGGNGSSNGGGSTVPSGSNGAGDPAHDQQLRDHEAALVADMFKRDRIGRSQLGLLR